ncbi:murein hydrolase activator EnvC family protein [Sphingomonas sp. FW199]|uniref:murein hydrolase activator EnvC family protein n=1 Tax=Sphingomonas sp. FW199 TaxID=3400217 RepID=UPI003CF5D6E3
MAARPILALIALATLGAAPAADIARQRAALAEARQASAAAAERARALEQQAADAGDAAIRAGQARAALVARIAEAEAELTAARARVALAARLLGEQRRRLVERQQGIVRLIAAIQSLARRPAALALARPGSTDDIVHARAVLGTLVPVIRQRTAAIRREIAGSQRLRAAASQSVDALSRSRATLETRRIELARLESTERLRAERLGRVALGESDRAIALGERARDLIDQMAEGDRAQAVLGDLMALPDPLPRPGKSGATAAVRGTAPGYRVPAMGRVVAGYGGVTSAGVRARGTTLAAAPLAVVVAPAQGQVIHAASFRSYGGVVIVDHGAGWTTLISGLDTISVRTGQQVAAGQPLGRMAASGTPELTVELRRRGRPVDWLSLID